jgi:chemotaxis protein methyltransferase CheR
MPYPHDSVGVSDTAYILLRDLIRDKIGMYFGEGRRDLLLDRLSPLVLERGFGHYLDYYYLLKYDPTAADEWQRVADALAVPETYFWREADQIRALANVVVPEYAERGGPWPLRIWSAACSSGEEPLTIAMALDEAGWLDRIPIEIVGSDISAAALARAQSGLYRERSLRALSPALRARYFAPAGNQWQVSPYLLKRVQWQRVNLVVPDEIAPLATAPVIFCRNVFIYLTDETIQRVACLLGAQMPAPGYLFVAAAESLLRFATQFELQEIGGALVYVKCR